MIRNTIKPLILLALNKNSSALFRERSFMGEEKPDEELMGKRKSSPRLSTASLNADNFMISAAAPIYTCWTNNNNAG